MEGGGAEEIGCCCERLASEREEKKIVSGGGCWGSVVRLRVTDGEEGGTTESADDRGSDGMPVCDTTKRLMSSPKCRSVEVINNPARPGSNHREVNCINYK